MYTNSKAIQTKRVQSYMQKYSHRQTHAVPRMRTLRVTSSNGFQHSNEVITHFHSVLTLFHSYSYASTINRSYVFTHWYNSCTQFYSRVQVHSYSHICLWPHGKCHSHVYIFPTHSLIDTHHSFTQIHSLPLTLSARSHTAFALSLSEQDRRGACVCISAWQSGRVLGILSGGGEGVECDVPVYMCVCVCVCVRARGGRV